MGDLICTTAELNAAMDAARAEGVLALDTEFVWKRTYRPQLGLVQIGCRATCQALDCCKCLDAAALKDAIEDDGVVKILHDAHQDLMHLRHWTGARPCNVFDTQLAAAFAGFPAGIGLQKLLFDALDVGLAKTETLTDWLQRPLSPQQVAYALDDVRYLPDLRDELLARADNFCTRAWLEEEMTRYDDASSYDDGIPEAAWERVKTGRVRLDGRGRAVLRAVAALREETARTWNLPRGWLGDDPSLVEMASSFSPTRLRHRLHGGRGDTLRALYAQAIAEARELPEDEWPADVHVRYLREVVDAADAALAWLQERAGELHVAAATIASRAVVTAYLDNPDDETNPLASGWRYEVAGREMVERFGVA